MLNFMQVLNVTGLQILSCAVAKNKILKPLPYPFHNKPPVFSQITGVWSRQQS